MEVGGHLVGRDPERELIGSLLDRAAEGSPSALLVAGESGIGKTSLVAEATSGPGAEGHLVLWGRCLRFGADSSPYLPFAQVLTQWYRQADDTERARVLAGAEHLATIAPALGTGGAQADSTRLVPLVATVLDRMSTRRPLVLVVDDAQWADGTSLDLLAYLIAGFTAGQRLALLVTYRDTELGEGHRMHGWLADVVRLPSVSRVRLGRLGYADIEELVARVTGSGDADQAAAVFSRAQGNPYYSELLAGQTAATSSAAEDGDLPRALLGSWHRLDAGVRELLQLLAVGGRPVPVDVLERLVGKRGGPSDRVVEWLGDAAAVGLVAVGTDGEAWFHHPLIADVVGSTLPTARQQDLHLEYVAVLESLPDLTPAERSAHLALHHDGAGNRSSAFAWSLRAADESASVHGYAETADHLHRACVLYDRLDEDDRSAAGGRTALWLRACESAWSAGEFELAIRLRDEAIAAADPDDDPVLALRVRLPVVQWRHVRGLDPTSATTSAQALLELAVRYCEGTAEHAQALAQLAFSEAWDGELEASRKHAADAVRIGRRTGSSRALAWGLAIRSQSSPLASDGLADALQALQLGREVDDPLLVGVTAIGCANCYERLGRRSDAADVLLASFDQLKATHSVHDAMWTEPAYAVASLIELGRWPEASRVLRELLSQRQPPRNTAKVRALAAVLAFRKGEPGAGHVHLSRAMGLSGDRGAGGLVGFLTVEGLWAQGEHRAALGLATDRMAEEATTALSLSAADELIALASHVAADLAEQPGARAEAVSLLAGIESFCLTDGQWTGTEPHQDALHGAYLQVYGAERARCHADANVSERWRVAEAGCRTAGLVWQEALASYQLGRSLLAERGSRAEAASALRGAARIASELGADPLLRDVEHLAAQAHVSLDEVEPHAAVAAEGDRLRAALTPRELEVLTHVVAGRTYAEIARALFISEKTVSVHVSNLLRKTGTSSRIELAHLVRRTS
jgi:DNA-binding CsgD family transcriptional regulator